MAGRSASTPRRRPRCWRCSRWRAVSSAGNGWPRCSGRRPTPARRGADPLNRAVRLYRDDFLAGFALRGCPEFDDWQTATADRLRQELAGALERLVAACVADGDLAHAVDHARRWLSLDQLHEPAHQALIRLQAWTGQRSAAVPSTAPWWGFWTANWP